MRLIAALILMLTLTACSDSGPAPGQAIAIVGARLEPGLDLEPIPFSVVVIENGKFAAVGPQQTTPVPKGAQTVDGKGFIVLPLPYTATIAPGEPANLMLRDAETGTPADIMQDGQWIQ